VTSPLTTHVLDTARGVPAAGVRVTVHREERAGVWTCVAEGTTDVDGRHRDLLEPGGMRPGAYRIAFDAGAYFRAQSVDAFWREVVVEFVVTEGMAHVHVPLLVSPFGYSTYRGS
jgi:5-hydroxyisourate hydrolase